MSYSEAGKGDSPRPYSVPADEFRRRWERAFGGQHTKGRCPRCNSGASVCVGWLRECLRCGHKYR